MSCSARSRAVVGLIAVVLLVGCTGHAKGKPQSSGTTLVLRNHQTIVVPDSALVRPSLPAAIRNRAILLNVWATWCTPCRAEFHVLQSLHAEYSSKGLVVIGLNVEDSTAEKRIARFVGDQGVTFSIWHNSDTLILPQLDISGLPTSVLFDSRGRELWRRIGAVEVGDRELTNRLRKLLVEKT